MFVVTQDGKLYTFFIDEIAPSREDQMFSKFRPSKTGKLEADSPMHVKELPELQMIATGSDHLIALDKTGKVWAMGDDTFG